MLRMLELEVIMTQNRNRYMMASWVGYRITKKRTTRDKTISGSAFFVWQQFRTNY